MPILLVSMSLIFEYSDVSSADILHIDFKPSGKSFISIKNNKEPKTELCGTPARILVHFDVRPLSRTRCWRFAK